MFNPPTEVVAARDHMFHVTKSLLQATRIHDRSVKSCTSVPSLKRPSNAIHWSTNQKKFLAWFWILITATNEEIRTKLRKSTDFTNSLPFKGGKLNYTSCAGFVNFSLQSVSFCEFSKCANSVIIELKRGLFKSLFVPLYNFVSYESSRGTCS